MDTHYVFLLGDLGVTIMICVAVATLGLLMGLVWVIDTYKRK